MMRRPAARRQKKTQVKKTQKQRKKTKKQMKKTSSSLCLEEDPAEEDHIFKPAESLHFQNGDDNSSKPRCSPKTLRPATR